MGHTELMNGYQWNQLFFLIIMFSQMGLSENRLNPYSPNGFADHYPVFKWLFHWGYTPFSDIPIYIYIYPI